MVAVERKIQVKIVARGRERHPAEDGAIAIREILGGNRPAHHVALVVGHDGGAPNRAEAADGIRGARTGIAKLDRRSARRNPIRVVGAISELDRDALSAALHAIFEKLARVSRPFRKRPRLQTADQRFPFRFQLQARVQHRHRNPLREQRLCAGNAGWSGTHYVMHLFLKAGVSVGLGFIVWRSPCRNAVFEDSRPRAYLKRQEIFNLGTFDSPFPTRRG